MDTAALYDQLAALLAYPGADYRERLARCASTLASAEPGAAPLLAEFASTVNAHGPTELQELFTQTFDLNPVCSLEVGWHLYGEQYERGAFLVEMRAALRRHGVAESTELPDHLTHLLRLLARMEPAEAAPLAGARLLPALDKMRAGLKGKENPFEPLLEAMARVLESRYPRLQPVQSAAPALRVLET